MRSTASSRGPGIGRTPKAASPRSGRGMLPSRTRGLESRRVGCGALATGGLPATTLARLAGHADAGFTLRVYASDPRDDAAVAASVLALAAEAGFGG